MTVYNSNNLIISKKPQAFVFPWTEKWTFYDTSTGNTVTVDTTNKKIYIYEDINWKPLDNKEHQKLWLDDNFESFDVSLSVKRDHPLQYQEWIIFQKALWWKFVAMVSKEIPQTFDTEKWYYVDEDGKQIQNKEIPYELRDFQWNKYENAIKVTWWIEKAVLYFWDSFRTFWMDRDKVDSHQLDLFLYKLDKIDDNYSPNLAKSKIHFSELDSWSKEEKIMGMKNTFFYPFWDKLFYTYLWYQRNIIYGIIDSTGKSLYREMEYISSDVSLLKEVIKSEMEWFEINWKTYFKIPRKSNDGKKVLYSIVDENFSNVWLPQGYKELSISLDWIFIGKKKDENTWEENIVVIKSWIYLWNDSIEEIIIPETEKFSIWIDYSQQVGMKDQLTIHKNWYVCLFKMDSNWEMPYILNINTLELNRVSTNSISNPKGYFSKLNFTRDWYMIIWDGNEQSIYNPNNTKLISLTKWWNSITNSNPVFKPYDFEWWIFTGNISFKAIKTPNRQWIDKPGQKILVKMNDCFSEYKKLNKLWDEYIVVWDKAVKNKWQLLDGNYNEYLARATSSDRSKNNFIEINWKKFNKNIVFKKF